MEKKKFPTVAQVAKIASFLLLFSLAPHVPSSLRPPYLYLLFNALVVALGVEAGFLAAISGPRDDKLPKLVASPPRPIGSSKAIDQVVVAADAITSSSAVITAAASPAESVVAGGGVAALAKTTKKIKASASKKMVMKRCPSRASIFFIGGGEGDYQDVHGAVEEEAAGYGGGEQVMSKQELFTKAEAFIGNFYKQLKMQREESWKKLQDLYHHHHHHYKTKAL
uniref:DUF4408 domain-containing protein n=1 Tax=Leersia perrieri TaxID=77586 RepID=A0A0D9V1R3_9ORYZ